MLSAPYTTSSGTTSSSVNEGELVYQYPRSLALSWGKFKAVDFAGSGVPHGD